MFLPRRKFSHFGLTPIEVLVSLGAVSLLAGVVAAGANGGSQSDRRNRCLGNLRTIMQTALTYAENDPKNILGPVHPEGDSFWYEGYAEYGGGPGTMNYVGWGEEFDPRTRPFNEMLYGLEFGEAGVSNTAPGDPAFYREFLCAGLDQGWQSWPDFLTDPRETETAYFKANGTSYRMNNLPFYDDQSIGIYGRPAHRIPAPSKTISFMEARVFQTAWTNDIWGSLEPGELTGYHHRLGYFNVSYADGHVEFADFGDGTFFEQPPDMGDLSFLFWRGTWGRMDCLPESPSGDGSFLARSSGRLTPQTSVLRRVGE
ncbi:MAG TPA: hypothetical protein VJZ71_03870 [Phycisphaerae bacterium]|nr:hypothetical protein [Phycisphaerae bacterium]